MQDDLQFPPPRRRIRGELVAARRSTRQAGRNRERLFHHVVVDLTAPHFRQVAAFLGGWWTSRIVTLAMSGCSNCQDEVMLCLSLRPGTNPLRAALDFFDVTTPYAALDLDGTVRRISARRRSGIMPYSALQRRAPADEGVPVRLPDPHSALHVPLEPAGPGTGSLTSPRLHRLRQGTPRASIPGQALFSWRNTWARAGQRISDLLDFATKSPDRGTGTHELPCPACAPSAVFALLLARSLRLIEPMAAPLFALYARRSVRDLHPRSSWRSRCEVF